MRERLVTSCCVFFWKIDDWGINFQESGTGDAVRIAVSLALLGFFGFDAVQG